MSNTKYGIGIEIGDTSFGAAYFDRDKTQVHRRLHSDLSQRNSQLNSTIDRAQSRVYSPTTSLPLDNRLIDIASILRDQLGERNIFDRLTITIPELYYKSLSMADKIDLKRTICSELQIDTQHLKILSHPVSAATLWIEQRQQRAIPYSGNLLIFDAGRNALRTHLCRISDSKKVEILHSEESTVSGRLFDLECIKLCSAQNEPDESEENSEELEKLLKYFESAKTINSDKSAQRLKLYMKTPALMKNYNLYCFGGGYATKCHQVVSAFDSIKQPIQSAVIGIQEWLEENDQSFDFLVFIGGFSNFILVQKTLFSALGIQENDNRFDNVFSQNFRTCAVVRGANLIANDVIDPVERFPFTLGIIGESLNPSSVVEQQFIPLISEGCPIEELSELQYVPDLNVFSFQASLLPSILARQDKGKLSHKLTSLDFGPIVLPDFSAKQSWRVGMYMNEDGILTIIFKSKDGSQQAQCRIGTLSNILDL